MNAPTYTATGTKSQTAAKLNKNVFEVEIKNHDLLSDSYNSFLANARTNNAVTKTRGLVRGGGKKPWRQKGTGRARFGSSRNPIWRTGGIVFGPTGEENYKIGINAKARKLAIKQALTINAKNIIVIEDIKVKNHKTSEVSKLINKITDKKNVLLVSDNIDDKLTRSVKNIPNTYIVRPKSINAFNILNSDAVIINKKALLEIEQWLGGSNE